jgi:hypothetical protein
MSNSVRIDISGNNKPLNDTLKDSESMVSRFGSSITSIFSAVGSAVSSAFSMGSKVFDWGKMFVDAAAASQEAEFKLGAVLKATGGAAGFTKEQLIGLSEELQNTTKYEAETTQGAMGILASFRNVRGDVFIEATKSAQDMSTVLRTDLSGAAMQLGKALNDPVAGLQALKRSGVTFTDAQEAMINKMVKAGDVMGAQKIILDELKNEFGGAAEEVGKSFAGKMEQMKNRFGDIAEDLGFAIMPIIEKVMPMIEGVASFAEQIVVPAIEWIIEQFINWGTVIAEQCAPAFNMLVDVAIYSLTAVQTGVENFSEAWNTTITGISYYMVKFVEDVKHWFVEVLPKYIQWFVDNFGNLLEDAANFEMTILENMGKNIEEFITSVWKFMKGEGFDFTMTGLLEGFQSTLSELPVIAEREMTETEKILMKDFLKGAMSHSEKFAKNLEKNKAFMENFMKGGDEKDLDLSNTAKKVKAEDLTTKDDKKKHHDKEEKEHDKKGEFVGLEEMTKKIQSAAAGGESDKELRKKANEMIANLINENKGLVNAVVEGAKKAAELVTSEEKMGEALHGIGEQVGTAIGNTFGNFGGIMEGVGEIFTDIKDEMHQRNEMFKETTQEDLLTAMQQNNAKQDELIAGLDDIYSASKDQVEKQEETIDLLPNVGALK